jgi:hypothetical protein
MLAALLIMAAVPAWATVLPRPTRVVVVLAPYLTWDDVLGADMPATKALASLALLADMNVHNGAIGAGAPTVESQALVLSAGASVLATDGAYTAYDASETVGGGLTATDVYSRTRGTSAGTATVLYLGLPAQTKLNVATSLGNRIGALGSAIASRGALTVAIGNSDLGIGAAPADLSRPAGIVASDVNGRVLLGDVSTGVLADDPAAPYGVRADAGRFGATWDAAVARMDGDSAALVVLDPGDLAREHAAAPSMTANAAAAARSAALRSTDAIVALAVARSQPGDTVIVLAPVMDVPAGEPEHFAPLIMRTEDGGGLATAASTHRVGIVTLMDVSATIVHTLGATQPPEMVGSTITPASDSPATLAGRVAQLQRIDATARAVEAHRPAVSNVLIVATVLALLVAAFLAYRPYPGPPARLRAFVRGALLFMPCVPLAGTLEFAVWRYPTTSAQVLGLMVVLAAAVFGLALWVGRRRAPEVPMILVTGLASLVLLVDQWAGAPLSLATTFGYTVLQGSRYYGIGNEMAAFLLGCSMVCAALALDAWPGARWAPAARTWGWPVLGLVVTGTAAAPFLGANVGTAAWMTVGFLVGWLMLTGRRVWTWRNAAIAVVLVAVIVAGLVAIDVLRGTGAETHLGRAFGDLRSGGASTFVTLVVRKAQTNLRIAGRTTWTWLLLAIVLLFGYLRWRPKGGFAAMLASHPAFSAALGASLFAGVVGYLTEDSGIVIPALVLAPVAVTALYLMMSPTADGQAEAASAGGAANAAGRADGQAEPA